MDSFHFMVQLQFRKKQRKMMTANVSAYDNQQKSMMHTVLMVTLKGMWY